MEIIVIIPLSKIQVITSATTYVVNGIMTGTYSGQTTYNTFQSYGLNVNIGQFLFSEIHHRCYGRTFTESSQN